MFPHVDHDTCIFSREQLQTSDQLTPHSHNRMISQHLPRRVFANVQGPFLHHGSLPTKEWRL